jgi:hypothetical protein
MICFNNKVVLIRDLSDLMLQIIIDAWWASKNVSSKYSIAGNCSWPAYWWWLCFAQQNWGDWQPWKYMYCMSSSSSPFLSTCDQLSGETIVRNWSHRKVELINKVRSYSTDWFDRWRHSVGHPKLASRSRNYSSKMYFSHWKPPVVSERMWSVYLDASISEGYQTGRLQEWLKGCGVQT